MDPALSLPPAENALISDFWLPQTEIAGGRDKAGSTEGFFFAAKGGHNNESHNHNDLGSCVLYYNGKPCLIDIGREQYVAKTFSNRRYEIWTMQSQYHNLPKINGYDQKEGGQFKAKNTAFKSNSNKVNFSTDISGAYIPEAGIDKWVRSYQLDRGRKFLVSDDYEFKELKSDPTTLNFVTYCTVIKISDGILNLGGEDFNLEMRYNPEKVNPEIEFNEVLDPMLKRYWPEGITRIVFTLKDPGMKGNNQIEIIKTK